MAEKVEVVITGTDQLSSVLMGITRIGLAAFTAGLVGVGVFLKKSVDEAIAAEKALADLNATIKSTGGVAGVTAQEAIDLAAGLQRVTMFSDEAIISAQSMLLTFTNIGQDVFPQATEAVLNLATKMGGDPVNAAIQLGKALNDPIQGVTALRRVGVQLSDEQENMIKHFMELGDVASAQAVILGELEKEFGGLAEAMGNTFAGRLAIAKNALSDLQETIGFAILPALSKLATFFSDVFSDPAVMAGIESFANAIAELSMGAVDGLLNLFSSLEGLSIGEGFVALTEMFSTWVDGINWATLSQDIADGINSIDWALIGQQFNEGFGNIMDGLDTVISETDWGAMTTAGSLAVANFAAGIGGGDWEELKQVWSDNVDQLAQIIEEDNLGELFKPTFDSTVWETAFSELENIIKTSMAKIKSSGVAEAAVIGSSIATTISTALGAGIPKVVSVAWDLYSQLERVLDTIKKLFWTKFQEAMQMVIQAIEGMVGSVLSTVASFISRVRSVIKAINIPILVELPNFAQAVAAVEEGISELRAVAKSIAINIMMSLGLSVGNIGTQVGGGSNSVGAKVGGGKSNSKPNQITKKYASGGIASGPSSGYLATLHGTEAVIPLDGGAVPVALSGNRGGSPVIIQINYSPMLSMADEKELDTRLRPLIEKGVRNARLGLG